MKQTDLKVLKRLDAVLWFIWLLAPIYIFMAIKSTWSAPYIDLHLPKKALVVSAYSLNGQILIAASLVFEIVFYVLIVLLIHRLVRQFIKGEILISATLTTMKRFAYLFITVPLALFVIYNINLYLLYKFGDLPMWEPLYQPDLVAFSIGLLFLALHILIKHAVALQKDIDLTV